MSLYPPPLDQRWAQAISGVLSRLKNLESRTAGIDSGSTLAALPGTVDPAYSSGDPRVAINGAALSGPYQHLAAYTPAANDAVIVLPVVLASGPTFVVLGKLA